MKKKKKKSSKRKFKKLKKPSSKKIKNSRRKKRQKKRKSKKLPKNHKTRGKKKLKLGKAKLRKKNKKTRVIISSFLSFSDKVKSLLKFNFDIDRSLQSFFNKVSNKVLEVKQVILEERERQKLLKINAMEKEKNEICGLRLKRCSRGINKLEGNLYLKELVYNLICNEKIDTLCLDIAYFYTLSNYMKRNNKNLNSINIKTICINQIITLMNPYWDLTLYSLKQIIKTFKKLNNILYLDLEFNNLYLNIYKRECELKELKEINDYNNNSRKLGCYLKKNDINLKLKLKLTNEYNIFFKKDKNLKILNNTNI